jgi:hypothetical protein
MAAALTTQQALRARMRSQSLIGGGLPDVAAVARHLGAVQAQSIRAARLAVRPRCGTSRAAGVDEATNRTRSVVRSWLMRGTLHLVPAEDLGWMLELYRPPAGAVSRRHVQLGLSSDLLTGSLPVIRDVLAETGCLTRPALVRALADRGIQVPPGQAEYHLIAYAARQALVCRGADVGDDEPTYALLQDWVPEQRSLDRRESLLELGRRYFRGHGPASTADFATWSGLPAGTVREALTALREELDDVTVDGQPALVLSDGGSPAGEDGSPAGEDGSGGPGMVRLLGQFDPYLLGYRTRSASVPDGFARRVQAGGMIAACVVADGIVLGTWRRVPRRHHVDVVVEPFAPLAPALHPALEAEAADLSRFLAVPLRLHISAL